MQFSVRMELHGKCMTSLFPYMEIVWLVFLVIPGRYQRGGGQLLSRSVEFNGLVWGFKYFQNNTFSNGFIPVPRKFLFSELKYFVSNLISGQKFFLKCLNKAWIFFKYFISYPNSDQKLAQVV